MTVVLTSNVAATLAALRASAEEVVVETANEIAEDAKHHSAVSAVEHKHMRDGWAVADPHADAPDPNVIRREVVNPVWYTRLVELGTRLKAARPMATPAAQKARPRFIERMRGIAK